MPRALDLEILRTIYRAELERWPVANGPGEPDTPGPPISRPGSAFIYAAHWPAGEADIDESLAHLLRRALIETEYPTVLSGRWRRNDGGIFELSFASGPLEMAPLHLRSWEFVIFGADGERLEARKSALPASPKQDMTVFAKKPQVGYRITAKGIDLLDANPHQRPATRRPRGAPRKRASQEERMLAAWESRNYRTYADCARAGGFGELELRRCVDRNRQRSKRERDASRG